MSLRTLPSRNLCACRRGGEYRHAFNYLGQYLYDVDHARALVEDGRTPVEVDRASTRDSVDDYALDESYVDPADPLEPGVVAHIRYRTRDGRLVRGRVLIDGHYRAAYCLREGLPFFAYLLTEEESEEVLLRKPDYLHQ